MQLAIVGGYQDYKLHLLKAVWTAPPPVATNWSGTFINLEVDFPDPKVNTRE